MIPPQVIAGLTGGVINSVFGTSEEERRNEQRRKMIESYLRRQKENEARAAGYRTKSDTTYSGRINDRRAGVNMKLAESGVDPVGSMYSNEKDLVNANVQEKANIDENTAEQNAQLMSGVDELNAGMETEPGFFENFISGGLKGMNHASGVMDAIKKPDLGGGTIGITDNNPSVTTGNNLNTSSILGTYDQVKKKKLNKYGNVSVPSEYMLP